MPTFVEMSQWSPEDALQQAYGLLPEGWTLDFQPNITYAAIRDEDGSIRWDTYVADPSALALSAYGWLLTREAKPTGIWSPRTSELTTESVTRARVSAPDPGDLDPSELDSVYSHRR